PRLQVRNRQPDAHCSVVDRQNRRPANLCHARLFDGFPLRRTHASIIPACTARHPVSHQLLRGSQRLCVVLFSLQSFRPCAPFTHPSQTPCFFICSSSPVSFNCFS